MAGDMSSILHCPKCDEPVGWNRKGGVRFWTNEETGERISGCECQVCGADLGDPDKAFDGPVEGRREDPTE